MKNWLLRLALLVALVALGILAWRLLFPNQERIIRKRLAELAECASFQQNEAPLAKLANSQKLGTFFTSDVEITVNPPGRMQHTIAGREELLQAAAAARTQLTSLALEFPDILVNLGDDRLSAVVNLTAKGKIGGERDLYVQEFEFSLRKVDGTWLISQIRPVKTLR
jgi:hypothetical protein